MTRLVTTLPPKTGSRRHGDQSTVCRAGVPGAVPKGLCPCAGPIARSAAWRVPAPEQVNRARRHSGSPGLRRGPTRVLLRANGAFLWVTPRRLLSPRSHRGGCCGRVPVAPHTSPGLLHCVAEAEEWVTVVAPEYPREALPRRPFESRAPSKVLATRTPPRARTPGNYRKLRTIFGILVCAPGAKHSCKNRTQEVAGSSPASSISRIAVTMWVSRLSGSVPLHQRA